MKRRARTIEELRAKVRLEIWRYRLQHGSGGHDLCHGTPPEKLTAHISESWFVNWPVFGSEASLRAASAISHPAPDLVGHDPESAMTDGVSRAKALV